MLFCRREEGARVALQPCFPLPAKISRCCCFDFLPSTRDSQKWHRLLLEKVRFVSGLPFYSFLVNAVAWHPKQGRCRANKVLIVFLPNVWSSQKRGQEATRCKQLGFWKHPKSIPLLPAIRWSSHTCRCEGLVWGGMGSGAPTQFCFSLPAPSSTFPRHQDGDVALARGGS